MQRTTHISKAAIILGFYNGNKYIEEQVSSILNQSYKDFDLFIFDDNSSQKFSFENLKFDEDGLKKINITKREVNLGFAKNFLFALKSISNTYDYYAFSDQDDIWHEDKLKEAINCLEKFPKKKPSLYGGRTELIGENRQIKLGKSTLFKKKPSFKNALIQNISGGNTMVFNNSAHKIITGSNINKKIIAHDWWCYQIVSGSGGEIVYDKRIFTKYRQHEKNLIGSNVSINNKWARFKKVINNEFKIQNDQNLEALINNIHLLTTTNKDSLKNFIKAKNSYLVNNLFYLFKSGVYRQTLFGNIALYIGICFKKI